MLQKTHSDLRNAADWADEWDEVSVFSHSTSLSGRITILFCYSVSLTYQVDEVGLVKGRLLKDRE